MILELISQKWITPLVVLFLLSGPMHGQPPKDPGHSREVSLMLDNDYPFMTDQYYTSGVDFFYRILAPRFPIFHKSDTSKTILSFHYGNKLFNPKNLDTDDPQYMDRPYCGWNFVGIGVTNFNRKNTGNTLELQMGLVGKESGMGDLQQWWHKAINLYALEGWAYQISDEFVVNLNYNHLQAIPITKGIEVVSNTGAWVGNGSNKITEELTVRLFSFKPLRESSFNNARLSKASNSKKPEFFFFASAEVDYVISNIFFEGSLFKDNPSPFTTKAQPWFFNQKLGVQFTKNRTSVALSMVHLTKENYQVSTHNYASLSLAYQFK